jgi:chromosome segregation ATPase
MFSILQREQMTPTNIRYEVEAERAEIVSVSFKHNQAQPALYYPQTTMSNVISKLNNLASDIAVIKDRLTTLEDKGENHAAYIEDPARKLEKHLQEDADKEECEVCHDIFVLCSMKCGHKICYMLGNAGASERP